jgi:hypothetical protein
MLNGYVGQKVRVFIDRLDARLAYVDHPKMGVRVA